MMKLSNKIVFVAGGTSGVGLEAAKLSVAVAKGIPSLLLLATANDIWTVRLQFLHCLAEIF
jgi:NADP-dependent 3-hydroxy acid dehydrogenase YdfG